MQPVFLSPNRLTPVFCVAHNPLNKHPPRRDCQADMNAWTLKATPITVQLGYELLGHAERSARGSRGLAREPKEWEVSERRQGRTVVQTELHQWEAPQLKDLHPGVLHVIWGHEDGQ
jgi:hypothetical protein